MLRNRADVATSAKESRRRYQGRRFVVDGGPALKRIRANTMGRAFRILKRQSHVTITLDTRKGGSEGGN